MHQVFISHSSKDKAVADAVCESLEDEGIGCWIAPRDISPGTAWAAAIDRAIHTSQLMVLILSEHSNTSPQVVREVCSAVEQRVGLIPFRIQDSLPTGAMKYFVSTVHWFNALTPPLDDHISRLVENTQRLLHQKAGVAPVLVERVVLPSWTAANVSLIGREQEMDLLSQAWAKAHAGSAQIALISGKPGMGKTRLVQDFVTMQAGIGAQWLVSKAATGDLPLPYAALEQALRPVVEQGVVPDIPAEYLAEVAHDLPELATLRPGLPAPRDLEPEQARPWRQRAWANFLVALARRAPIVLYLDDLQWVDQASLDCMRCVLMQHPHEPLLIIASLRDENGKQEAHIREFSIDLHKRGLLTEITLSPLTQEETHELLKTMSGMPQIPRFSRRLHEHTEGNPFFLLETIQALFANGTLYKDDQGDWATVYDDFTKDYAELPLPERVSDLMAPHFAGLEKDTHRYLDAAAVIGRTFDLFMAQEISGLARYQLADVIDELVTRGIIWSERRSCVFTSALMYESVIQTLNFLTSLELHERAAEALERTLGATPSPSQIQQLAHHTYLAELWSPAFDYQLQAGLSAWSDFEAHAARRYLETANEILENELEAQVSEEQKLACLKGLGDVYANLGPYERALDYYQAVLERVEAEPIHKAELCWKMAVVYERQPQYDQAIRWLDRGIAALHENEDPALLSRLYMQHGLINCKRGQIDEAFDYATKALIAESPQAHNLLAVIHRTRGELEPALSHCDRCIALSEAAGDLISLSKGHTNRGVVLVDLDRWGEAVESYQQALELLIDTGDAYVHAMTLGNLADIQRYLGDLDAAHETAKTALEESKILDSEFDIALAHLNQGEILIDQGEPRQARVEHLQVGLDQLNKHEIWDLLSQAERDIAQSYLDEGLLDEAQAAAKRAVSAASEPVSWPDLGKAKRILGLILHQGGQIGEGEALIRESLEIHTEHGPRYALAQSHLALAELLSADRNRSREAQMALDAAGAICEALGAGLCLERARALERVLSEQ